VWGVIRDGHSVVADAIDALVKFRAQGGTVVLLSNSPRRARSLITHLEGLGAPRDAFDAAVTSGEAIFAELTRLAPGPAFKLGPDYDDPLYDGAGLDFAPLEDAAFISCTGLFDDQTETPDDYEDLLRQAQLRRLPMVCANPDTVVQLGDALVYCAGALADRYSAMGGQVIIAGKPNPPIYDLAYTRVEEIRGGAVDKPRILAIGDGPATDIKGAVAEGLDALFIAGGINARQLSGPFDPGAAEALLSEQGLSARWIAPSLVW
jgi:HAD superfamily hydrolase (TIGR01459 family)